MRMGSCFVCPAVTASQHKLRQLAHAVAATRVSSCLWSVSVMKAGQHEDSFFSMLPGPSRTAHFQQLLIQLKEEKVCY